VKLESAIAMAQREQLYPSVILFGADPEARMQAAVRLAQATLCDLAPELRPCGECRHCRRLVWPPLDEETFHPDLLVLERDRATVTSVEATKQFLRRSQVAPFEARGQAFIIASAESLSGEAANALLKTLEEPPERAPRHFFLLTPSQFDLLPTLRSRSLEIFLGASGRPDPEAVEKISADFSNCIDCWQRERDTTHLLAAASVLESAGDFKDPRATDPWVMAAAAVRSAADRSEGERSRCLHLAMELLDAPQIRVRGIPARRVLEGLTVRCFAGPA